MIKYQDNLAARVNGNNLQPLAGAEVRVTDKATGLLAALFQDNELTPIPQPLTTDNNGYYAFKAADGKYILTFSAAQNSPRFDAFTREIVLEDPADNPFATLQELALPNGAGKVGYGGRTLADKLGEVISVKDFGAKGDGVTDDTTAIQAALDAAGGRVLVFPSGIYLQSGLTLNKSNVTLRGEGRRATVLKRKAGLAADIGGLTVIQCSNISISGIGFDGNKANQAAACSGLSFASAGGGVSGVVLEDVDAFDWGEPTDVDFAAGIVLYSATGVRLTRCNATGNAHYGINAYECKNIQVHNCQSNGNGRHGYGAAGTMRFEYIGNIAEENRLQGFWFRNVEEGLIALNIVRWSSVSATDVRYGIQIKRSTEAGETAGNSLAKRVLLTGNQILGASDSLTTPGTSKGIYIQANASTSNEVTASGNMIVDCDYGTYAPNGENISYIANTIIGAKVFAMWDDGINNAVYHGNIIRDCKRHGIYSRCRYGSIKGNSINSAALDATATYYGIWYADRSDTVIANNDVGDLNVAVDFLHAVYLAGAFTTRVKVHDNMLKNTGSPVGKSGDYGTSGSGNAEWDNYNSSAFGPYAAARYSGALYMGADQTAPAILTGTGSPEGAVAARIGSLFLRADGGAGTTLYVKQSLTGNTGWIAK